MHPHPLKHQLHWPHKPLQLLPHLLLLLPLPWLLPVVHLLLWWQLLLVRRRLLHPCHARLDEVLC